MDADPTPINSPVAAQRWAVELLRRTADALERAPREQLLEALPRLAYVLEQLERQAALVLGGRAP